MEKTTITGVHYQVVKTFQDGETDAMIVLSKVPGVATIDFYQCGGIDIDGQKYNLIHWYKGKKDMASSYFIMYPVFN
jgi:hypothetical protein